MLSVIRGKYKTHQTESRVVEGVGEDHHEEGVAGSAILEADGPIPGDEEDEGAEDIPRELDEDLRGHQRRPAIHAAGAFTNLVNRAHFDERYLELVRQGNTRGSVSATMMVSKNDG